MILELNEEEKQLILDALGAAEGEVVGLRRWAVIRPKVEALEAKIKALRFDLDDDI
jgi:hypothetical protein